MSGKVYNVTYTKAGKYVEKRTYERPVLYGFSAKGAGARRYSTKERRRSDNITRAKKRLLYKVLANSRKQKPFFCTLTFKNEPETRLHVIKHVQCFVRRLRRHYPGVRYAYVIEEGSRSGRLHVHMLIFEKYVDYNVLLDCWEVGLCNFKKTNDAKHIAFYMGKYLGKDFHQHGGRLFNVSHGLERETVIRQYFTSRISALERPQNKVYSGGYFNSRGDFIYLDIYYADTS